VATLTHGRAMLVMADHSRVDRVSAGPGRWPEALPGTRVERHWTLPAEAVAGALATHPVAG
jgi:hypothetical protein